MSPSEIVKNALRKGLDIIGITDHNATGNAKITKEIGERNGLFVLCGAELSTSEEVHCLAFFENTDALDRLQDYIDMNLPFVKNISSLFGYQLEVDENEIITREEDRLLTSALLAKLSDVQLFIHSLGGLFIPAHADRLRNSIYSQLGMLPGGLDADAVELSRNCKTTNFLSSHPELKPFTLIRSSDSHCPGDIGTASTEFMIEKPCFDEIRMALRGINGRYVERI
jgi:hypothetical protein